MRTTTTTREHRDYWDSFYENDSGKLPGDPSAFARWVQTQLLVGQPVVEFGFGNGRDSLFFASKGHPLRGYDFAQSAVELAQAHADSQGLGATFGVVDLYDESEVDQLRAGPANGNGNGNGTTAAPALYGRFLIHSLEDHGRANLLDHAATLLRHGGELYLEFRTGQDRNQQHAFGDDHFRNFLDPSVVADEIEQRGGVIVQLETGHGLAIFKSEDPHIARIVARFTS